jgi:hypothetical protein
MMRFLFCPPRVLVPPPIPLPWHALALLCRLVAVADVLLGMITIDLLVLQGG